MVTTVVNSLVDRLLEAFPPTRSYGLSDFSGNPMPGPVRDFLKQEMSVRLARAVLEPGPDSWIDVDHGEVHRARNAYLKALAMHQRIPAHAWEGVLDRACDECVRVLVRPASSLAAIVFEDGSETIEPADLLAKFDYFAFYPYFREVVEAYVEQKGIASINSARLEGLLNRIDREMSSDNGPADWIRLLRPLLSVLRAAGYSDDVPVEVLTAFLDEKGADAALHRLRNHYEERGRVSTGVLAELFQPEAGDGAAASRPQPEPRPEDRPAPQRDPVPLWKQFEQGRVVKEDEPVVEPSRGPSGEPLWKQFRSAPESKSVTRPSGRPLPEVPFSELEAEVLGRRGVRNRDLFIRHLFSGDRDAYEAILRKLRSVTSWSEASKVIAQDVFLKYQVNIYSDPAVAFTDAAESRYRR